MNSFKVNAISFLNSNTAVFSTSLSLTGDDTYFKWFKSTVLHSFFPGIILPLLRVQTKYYMEVTRHQKLICILIPELYC